jgi:hypothetical protein
MAHSTRAKRNQYMRSHNRTPKRRYYTCKQGAKERRISFTLTLEECEKIWASPCFYGAGECMLPETRFGMDRLDNRKGYEPDNVVPCCTFHNKLRNNYLTPGETVELSRALRAFRRGQSVVDLAALSAEVLQ